MVDFNFNVKNTSTGDLFLSAQTIFGIATELVST